MIHLADDSSPDVKLQVVIAACKLDDIDPLPVLVDVLKSAGDDPVIPIIVWQNAHPLLAKDSAKFLALVKERGIKLSPEFTKRMTERVLATRKK